MPHLEYNLAMTNDQSFGIIPYVIEDEQIKYLIIHHQKGHWAFPKGHAEENETPLETASRELLEETGITASDINPDQTFIERYVFTDPKTKKLINKKVTFFLGKAETTTVKIQDEELQGYAWVTLDEAMDLATFNQAKQLIKKVDNYLTTNQ